MMKQWYYEKNTKFIQSKHNKTFEEILLMSDDKFRQWVVELRKEVVRLWDEEGQPPRVGFVKEEIIEQFSNMDIMNPYSVVDLDQHTGVKDVINPSAVAGKAVNQFFPTMMKTRINYTDNGDAGKSIYDYFAKDELLETFLTYAKRHFKRDSFYNYSKCVGSGIEIKEWELSSFKSGVEWIKEFESKKKYRERLKLDYWLNGKDEEATYTGFSEHLRNKKDLRISKAEIEALGSLIPETSKTNINYDKHDSFTIRVYRRGMKLFPEGFKAFRVSFCQYAVNFPPPIAKFIYCKYTTDFKLEDKIYIWDPSCGWGGRLLGALSIRDERQLVYLGNDPNTDHTTTPGRTKYHEILDFYRDNVDANGGRVFQTPHNDMVFWQKGSEDMQHDPEFQKYKGKLSLVFTSPPYFSKEAYSEDDTQSYKKFDNYQVWKKGFLEETLKTAVEWLRPGGYIAWNVSDVVFSGETLPLEEDSNTILKSLGMVHIETLKMTLAQSQGGNRIDETTGLPKFKNFCIVNGHWRKYEPIFIYQKPK